MKNRSERRGFIWLSVALLMTLTVLIFIPSKKKPEKLTSEEESIVEEVGKRAKSNSYKWKSQKRKRNYPYTSVNHSDTRRVELSEPPFLKNEERKETSLLDINIADTIDLQELYGIGPYFAKAIVKYREQLGGYADKEQLREVYGMTEDRYQAIAPKVIVTDNKSVRKININTASVGTLLRHPYIDKHQARAIVKLRSMGETFHSADDLYKISILDKESIEKIIPYIDFSDDTIHSEPDGSNTKGEY